MTALTLFGDLPILETERLLLRKIRASDARDFYEYASDAEVSKHSTWSAHQSLADTRLFISSILNHYEAQHVAPWGIEHKADRKLIGTCGFASWITYHHRAEIGYALARSYWSQGHMTEAVRAVLRYGFDEMQLNRIEARCKLENIGSARVLEKVGMTCEGILRQHMFIKGHYHDLKLYAILRVNF